MARKEEKLRPYRVDYFDIDEMKDYDRALIRSQVVRAVTSTVAANSLTNEPGRIIIRAYRYYKKLGQSKRLVFKAVEDLFTSNKAVKVMEQVESYRKRKEIDAQFATYSDPLPAPAPDDNGHQTRFSDSSLYDEVCINCGATDASGKLDNPCPSAPKSGPDSPATKQVMTDYTGMFSHDAHEKTMETFVPSSPVPETVRGLGFPDAPVVPTKDAVFDHTIDLDAAAPVLHPAPSGDEIAIALEGTAEIVRQRAINDPMPGTPIFPPPDRIVGGEPLPLYMKLLIYGTFSALAIIIVLAILHGGK